MNLRIKRDGAGLPLIQTERLVLRTLSSLDAEALFKYRSKAEVLRFQHFHPTSIEDARDFIARASRSFTTESTWHQFGIFLQNGLIGDIGVHFFAGKNRNCEIGYTVDPSYQRRGYAREAVWGIVGLLFHELKKECVFAVVDVQNTPSIGLLRSIGFAELSSAPKAAEALQAGGMPECAREEVCFELTFDAWRSRSTEL